MKKVCRELIDFFRDQGGWDKDELLGDYVGEILKNAGSSTVYADELTVTDGDRDIMVLQDFANELFDRIIEGVCNVIETA